MDKIQKLEMIIEQLKVKLGNYLDDDKSEDEIYELSTQIDSLIVEYYNLTNKNQ